VPTPDAAGRPGLRLDPTGRGTTWALAALGTLLSALGSWHVSLWSDEAATISAAQRGYGDLLRMVDHIDAVHGTYYALMHPWVALVGTSPLGLRLPSALAAGAAVAGVHVLAGRLAGPRVALLAALVTALLPRVTWAGIEARPFALAMALGVWATVLLEAAVRRGGGARWAGYAVLLGLGAAVNMYVALLGVGHALTLVALRERRVVRPFLVSAVGAAVIAAPVLALAAGQGGQLGVQRRGVLGLPRDVLVDQWFLGETPTPTTASGAAGVDLLDPATAWKPAAVLLALVGWSLVATTLLRRARHRELVAWAVPWLVVPPVAVLAASVASPDLYTSRYFAICAPALGLLIGGALAGLRTRAAIAAAAALAVLVAPVYASQRTVGAKSGADWSMVAAELSGRTHAGDAVYFGPRDDLVDGVAKRSLRTASIAYPEPYRGLVDVTLIDSPARGATLFGTSAALATRVDRLADVDTLWVVRRQDRPAEGEADDRLLAGLGFTVVDTWDGPQTQVVELRR
jgi:mannosyltransferase